MKAKHFYDFYFRRFKNNVIEIGKTAKFSVIFNHLKWKPFYTKSMYTGKINPTSATLQGGSDFRGVSDKKDVEIVNRVGEVLSKRGLRFKPVDFNLLHTLLSIKVRKMCNLL